MFSKDETVIKAATTLASTRLSVGSIEAFAGANLLEKTDLRTVEVFREEYEKRRNTLHEELLKIEGIFGSKPQGAFYSAVGLPVEDAESFCSFMLGKFDYNGYTTFLCPVSGFYVGSEKGKNMVRMAYVLKSEDIKSAVKVVAEALKVYKSKR